MSRCSYLLVRLVPSVLVALLLLITLVARADAGSLKRVELQDKCDPTTFNAAIGPGTCVGDEDVTFDEFIAELTKERKVGAWRFNPDQFGQKPGQQLIATNTGGEFHSFTCVTQFGGGVVPILNELSGNMTPAVPCDPNQNPNFLAPGESTPVITLTAAGTHKFECLIHPWMRTTITVEDDR